MDIKVWYKEPAPMIEGPHGALIAAEDMAVKRIYRHVRFKYESGLLIIESQSVPHEVKAIYRDFDRVEPLE